MLKGKMKGLAGVLFAAVFLAFAGASQAQYIASGEMKADTSVIRILKKPVDGQPVFLKGNITKKSGESYYEFKDSTGAIRMKINETLFDDQKITENPAVEIFGEVSKTLTKSPYVEARRITVIKP